jgi:hypothetical protein
MEEIEKQHEEEAGIFSFLLLAESYSGRKLSVNGLASQISLRNHWLPGLPFFQDQRGLT